MVAMITQGPQGPAVMELDWRVSALQSNSITGDRATRVSVDVRLLGMRLIHCSLFIRM